MEASAADSVEESDVDSVEESLMEDDGKTSAETECKVIAGEVIRNCQTRTRGRGLHDFLHSLFVLFNKGQ